MNEIHFEALSPALSKTVVETQPFPSQISPLGSCALPDYADLDLAAGSSDLLGSSIRRLNQSQALSAEVSRKPPDFW